MATRPAGRQARAQSARPGANTGAGSGGVAAYVRVSSRSQDEAMQEAEITRAARASGAPIATWYRDRVSAGTLARPALAELRAAAQRGELRTLWIWRLDRLSRSGIRDTLALLEELRGAGVEVRSVTDAFPLHGPIASVVVAVIAWCAEFERSTMRERMRAARARVEASGGAWGRPPRASAVQIVRAQALAKRGRTIRSIAQAVGLPKSVVHEIVSGKRRYVAAANAAEKLPSKRD